MKRYKQIRNKLFHLGLQLGVPLLVTLHPLDLIRENLCHKQWIGDKLLSQNSGLGNK